MMDQMMLFNKPKTEIDSLWEAIAEMKLSQDKVRRRLFRELGEMEKELIVVKGENERLKSVTEMKPQLSWIA